MMKVLFLTNVPAPYRVDFFSELGKYVDLTVLFERENASNRNKKWIANRKSNFKAIFLKGKKIGAENSISLEIIKYLKDKKYDKIIIGQYSTCTAMLAILYMKIKKIPFILNSDGGFIKQDSKLKYKLKTFFISAADYWLSSSEMTNQYLAYYGADLNKCYIYPFSSVVNKDILKKTLNAKEKEEYKIKKGIKEKFAVISVGSFIYRKGYDILLKACKDVNKDIGVYIIGGKPTKEYLEIKNKLNLVHVHFIDFLSKKELMDYYKACDLFVHPTREDIWGLVVNEAMACSLPVITTKKCIAGLEMIENNYNGVLLENLEDPKEYAEKINILFLDKRKLRKLSSKSLKSIQNYTIENMATITYDILNKIK